MTPTYNLVDAILALLDATEDSDVQEIGGEPLEKARRYAIRVIEGRTDEIH